MAGVIKKPDEINLVGNLNEFVLSSSGLITFVLKRGDEILLQQSYEPGPDRMVRVDVKDVVEGQLSYTLDASQNLYIQPKLAETFTAMIDGANYSFRVVRAGVANLSDTAANWLKLHFLTWQPRVKQITYYSPEWLTYYATEACSVKLKATYPDKSTRNITLGTCVAGCATTINMQYSVIAGKLGYTYPSYYEVWTERSGGTKLSESQFYAFSDPISEEEQWFLFENSLGGLDTFRAAGTNNLAAEHEHNIAEFSGIREEYEVDTQRKYVKNTGYLDAYSRKWLLDFFPSKAKFIYEATAIRRIVVTESNATYVSNELPSSYTFTWQLAEVSAYLNLIKNKGDIPDNLVAPDLSSPDFFIPPRLAEYPRVLLSEGVLIPAFDPFAPKPTVTSFGEIFSTIKNAVVKELEDEIAKIGDGSGSGGSVGGSDIQIIKLNDLTQPSDENVFSSLRTLKEIDNVIVEVNGMFLRKDIDDRAHGNIGLDNKIGSTIYMDGWDGKGWCIENTGLGEFDALKVRSDVYLGGRIGSPSFASGFTGWGWEIDTPTASGTVDNWTVRKSAKFYEMICSQVYGLNSSFMVSDWNKIESVTPLGSNRYRCRINDLEGEMFVNLRNGDIVRTQKRDGWNIRYFASVVENVSSETFDLKVIEGEDRPQAGDYAQRIGSKTDKNRQGLIYFTSSDDHAPYIDILDGVTSAQFTEDNTKVRIGNREGIRINGKPIKGHGIYINGGVFVHSTYYMEDGNTIEQQFSIMDGKLTSEIEGVRSDISGEKGNILRNSSFASDLNYWTTTGNVHFIPVMGGFMWLPSAFYVDKEAVSDIYRDGSRNVLRIRNNSLTQINGVLNLPTHSEASEDGKYTYSFSFHYKVLRAGTLTVGVKGSDLYTSQSLPVSEEYQLMFHEGMWNEQGDFEISCSGEILIYGATLRNDSSADAFIYMKTGIEQSEEKIRLWATKELKDTEGRITTKYDSELKITAEEISQRVTRQEFNKETGKIREKYDGELSVMSNRISQRVTYSEFDDATGDLRRSLESSITTEAGRITAVSKEVDAVKKTISSAGWITTTTGNTLWAKKDMENGKTLISAINQTAEAVSINASKINLNGVVTANNSFKILTDGSLQCTGGKIASFNIGDNSFTISKNGIYAGFGISTGPGTLGIDVPLWIRNSASDSLCVAAYFEASGSTNKFNNVAISTKGAFEGLALKTRQTSSSVTLTNGDVFVSCYNQSSITVYLPTSPVTGKLIYVKNINGYNVTVNGNGKSIAANSTSSSITSGTTGEIMMFIFDGQYWAAAFIKW